MNWYYLKGGSWIGPVPDEEKKELMDWGVYPHFEEDFFGDFITQENEEDWRDEADEVENWRYDSEEEDEEEENYTVFTPEKEIEGDHVEENKMNKNWKEEKEEREEDLKTTGEENVEEETEDDLASTEDDSEFWKIITEFANVENSDDKFDDKFDPLVPDSSWDDKLESENEIGDYSESGDFPDDNIDVDFDSNVSDRSKDALTARLDALERRPKFTDDQLASTTPDLCVLEEICCRLDRLEAKTDATTENYGKLDANVQTLTIKVDAYDVNDCSTRLEAQDERLKAVEEQVEQVSQDIDGFLEDNESRLDALEERTETFDRTCEKITADIQALSVRIPVFEADAWKVRFDDQTEDLAIMREHIAGIERKINGEVEERKRQASALEEKSGKYEVVSRDVLAKVDSLGTTIQTWGKFVQTWNSFSARLDTLQRTQENFITQTSELSALQRSVDNLESRTSTFQTRFDSFERETNNADFIYEARFVKLEQKSKAFETKIQNLQNAVERNGANSASLSDIEEIVAKLQNGGIPSETRVKNLEVTSASFKSSLEAQKQLLTEQTRNLSETINSHTTVLTEQIERTQNLVKNLETNVQRLSEESTGTAFISRINQLFTKFQKLNKETQEESRRLKEYVDEQRLAVEKLADEITQKASFFSGQETGQNDEQEETMGTAFIGRINQLFTKFQIQMKEQEEKLRRFKEEQEEERRCFKEYIDEQYRALESLGKGSKKKWGLF